MHYHVPILATTLLGYLATIDGDRVTIIVRANYALLHKEAIITTFIKKKLSQRAITAKRVLISLVILAANNARTTKSYIETPRGGK